MYKSLFSFWQQAKVAFSVLYQFLELDTSKATTATKKSNNNNIKKPHKMKQKCLQKICNKTDKKNLNQQKTKWKQKPSTNTF